MTQILISPKAHLSLTKRSRLSIIHKEFFLDISQSIVLTIKVMSYQKYFILSFTICPLRLNTEYNGKIKTHETSPHGPFLIYLALRF